MRLEVQESQTNGFFGTKYGATVRLCLTTEERHVLLVKARSSIRPSHFRNQPMLDVDGLLGGLTYSACDLQDVKHFVYRARGFVGFLRHLVEETRGGKWRGGHREWGSSRRWS